MKSKYVVFAVVGALLAGCVTVPHEPVIDTQGVDPARYQADLADCQQLATSRVDQGSTTAANAATGAVVLGLIGAILGGGRGAAQGAGVGLVAGGAGGAATGYQAQRMIVGNCMTGRGYSVLAY